MSNFAVSDLHGCLTQWNAIQSFCKDSDRIFVLGDCADRSPTGFQTLQSVLADPRVTLIKGNHEQMMADSLEEERDYGCPDYWQYIWFNNGGFDTYCAWQEDGCDFTWIYTLKQLPLWAKYINQEGQEIIMTHSGCPPKRGYVVESLGQKACIWDRNHLRERRWHRSENEIWVGGHTPLPLMKEYGWKATESGAFWYCKGHKCNIDNGGYHTGNICLLDLDTFDEHIFTS